MNEEIMNNEMENQMENENIEINDEQTENISGGFNIMPQGQISKSNENLDLVPYPRIS